MRRPIHEALSLDIERAILDDPSYRLPRLLDLAAQHRVSYPTIWKAVRALIRKGLVVGSPGRRLCISPKIRGREQSEDRMPSSEIERIYRILRNEIADGVYRVGRPLPKVNYFLRTYNTSYHTLSRVFARLGAENLAHKQRSRWVAGPAPAVSPAPPGTTDRSQSPVALVVTEGPDAWNEAFTNSHSRNFMLHFTAEMTAWNVNLSVAALDNEHGMAYLTAVGPDEIETAVRALGARYCGTLILNAYPVDLAELMTRIIKLTKYKKPVVFFDSIGQGSFLDRRGSHAGRYYRLCFDEASAVRAALRMLAQNGHRVVGVHGCDLDPGGWTLRRTKLIEEIAPEHSVRIVRSGPSEEYWHFAKLYGVDELITTIAQQSARPGSSTRALLSPAQRNLLVRNAPSLVSLFAENAPTAMIALNDRLAREYFFWFDALGVVMPKDFSLISFDNIPESVFYPITTIDFGFARLGYRAAHIMIGDTPVHAGRNGVINSVCTVVDRGSVGPAADAQKVKQRLRP